jgi:hypothetical protein
MIGLSMGLVYLERWGSAQSSAAGKDEELTENL